MIKEEQENNQTNKSAATALILGILSLLLFAAAIVLGILIEAVGISGLMNFVLIPALAASIVGVFALRQPAGHRLAKAGIILAGIALALYFLARVGIFLLFIPWFGA